MKRAKQYTILLLILIVLGSVSLSTVWAQEGTSNAIDTGDTAWILVSSALVMCMILPGLALFYGGLVRSKNVLGTIMHTTIILCIISIVWVLWGYTLAFGPDIVHCGADLHVRSRHCGRGGDPHRGAVGRRGALRVRATHRAAGRTVLLPGV